MITSTSIHKRAPSIGLDANSHSFTTDIETKNAKSVGLFVKGNAGTHIVHEVILQAYDGVNWWDTTHKVTGEGFIFVELCICDKVRAKVSLVEGRDSTVDITIIIK